MTRPKSPTHSAPIRPTEPGPGSPFFLWQYVFADAGRLGLLTLIVDDSVAPFGVLTVVWADCV
jgi:hypothetical protein